MPRSALAALLLTAPLYAQTAPVQTYTRQEAMIPMRDGVKLHTVILRPADTKEPLPFLLTRTPYGVADSRAETYPELARAGYIFVEQDIRGRYGSEGQFVMLRPLAAHHDPQLHPHDVDESTDAYDTVAWLLKNVSGNNGKAGVFGVSYPGFLTMEAGIDPHPAVKAISPQAPMTDVWRGDDFFHNGAFRETYGYDYALGLESSKENEFPGMQPGEDAYDFFLRAGSFAGAIQGKPTLPTWEAFLRHPAYDVYWRARAVEDHLHTPAVPTLEVGGYWDQEDMWGPQEEYRALHAHDPGGLVRLALGPWNHGQWRGPAESLGGLDWGEPTGSEFQRDVEAPFFAHFLKGGPDSTAGVASFQTGTNQWRHYTAWPPPESTATPLYLSAGQTLSWTALKTTAIAGEYTADPAHPIPYRARPIEATYDPKGSHWRTWLAEDQRPATVRPDQMTWRGPLLNSALTVIGDVTADLWASTTGTDADWVVKLIDEYPNDPKLGKMAGYQLMVAEEIFRGRYRIGPDRPEATPANTPEHYTWSLHGVDHAFLPGHRVLVEVQSSWFPLYDRNPQTYMANIMEARPADFRPAIVRLLASPDHPSRILLPVEGSR